MTSASFAAEAGNRRTKTNEANSGRGSPTAVRRPRAGRRSKARTETSDKNRGRRGTAKNAGQVDKQRRPGEAKFQARCRRSTRDGPGGGSGWRWDGAGAAASRANPRHGKVKRGGADGGRPRGDPACRTWPRFARIVLCKKCVKPTIAKCTVETQRNLAKVRHELGRQRSLHHSAARRAARVLHTRCTRATIFW